MVNGSDYISDDPYSLLPEHMREGMRSYVNYGTPCGSFLAAVLKNDLMRALLEADHINMHALPKYGLFLYNHAPAHCYGSEENYHRWVEFQGMLNKEREGKNA